MSQIIFEISFPFALAFMVAAIVLAAALRSALANNSDASDAMLKRGHLFGGAASSVLTVNAAYLLPWKPLPRHVRLSLGQCALWRAAQCSAFISITAVVAGAAAQLVAG